MKIAKGKVVVLDYTLTVDDDTVIEDSLNQGPLRFVQGAGRVPQALEAGVEGLAVGERKEIVVPASEIFAPEASPTKTIPRSELPGAIKVGEPFQAKTADGAEVNFVVDSVSEKEVVVRFVHPLLGKDLNFNVQVTSIRDGSPAEVAQGFPMAPPKGGPVGEAPTPSGEPAPGGEQA